jgi:hypothetical protein
MDDSSRPAASSVAHVGSIAFAVIAEALNESGGNVQTDHGNVQTDHHNEQVCTMLGNQDAALLALRIAA